jgi:hypothetical protein
MAGYSTSSLQKKLGIKPGIETAIFNAPIEYWNLVSLLPEEVIIHKKPLPASLDFTHLFVVDNRVFQKEFIRYKGFLKKSGMLWISWPKRTSKIQTDLTENIIREFGLQNGLVDIKVCAINEIWSGLKFVYRLTDR